MYDFIKTLLLKVQHDSMGTAKSVGAFQFMAISIEA
jgi:hypothetical protein